MKRNIKKQIINTAISLFREKGVQNTSVDSIVEKAGIAKGTFFYHFKKKDNIVFEIIEMEFKNYLFVPEQIIENKEISAVEKMRKVLMSLFSAFKTSSILEQIFKFGVPLQYENYISELRLKVIIPVIANIIEQGKNEGSFKLANTDIISSILVRGIIAYIHTIYKKLDDPKVLQSLLSGIEELINNALKTSKRINIQ
jgi:AcrR family transcriptional regulator